MVFATTDLFDSRYFLKAFEFWPNVIAMGGIGANTVSSTTTQPDQQSTVAKRHKLIAESIIKSSKSVKGRSIQTAKYHPTIAKRGASLNALLMDQQYESSQILTRDEPLIAPDKNVLKHLVVHQPTNDETRAAAVTAAAEGRRWESPAVAVNNSILRQHFRLLTNAFLRPLDRYFKLSSVGSRAARIKGVRLSAYNEPPALFELFDEEEFMQMLETDQVSKLFQRTNWRTLYRKFIRGPHFWPWFHQKRLQLVNQLQIIYRHLRLHTDSDTLLGLVTTQHLGNAESKNKISVKDSGTLLYIKVKRALEVELSKPESQQDQDLCIKMKEHLAAVQALIKSSADISIQRTIVS